MTLAEIVRAFPDLFYRPYVAWYDGHDFMQREPHDLGQWLQTSEVELGGAPIYAADLAALYVKHPEWTIWGRFLWTADVDRWGSRVYVGGVGQYGIDAFQIHRHLAPNCYWVRAA